MNPQLVDRDDAQVFDATAEGEYIRQWESPSFRFEIGPCIGHVELIDGQCHIGPVWSETRWVTRKGLPPRLLRGVLPPIDCPFNPCKQCWRGLESEPAE